MLYLIIVFLIKSNHWTKIAESKLQCCSWSRCLENFVRYSEWRFKNRRRYCLLNWRFKIFRFWSRRIIFSFIIYNLKKNFKTIKLFTNSRMIAYFWSINNWRFFEKFFIIHFSFNRLSMIFLHISCLKAIAWHESSSFWIVVTIEDIRFDLSIILIFLSEENFNTEARQVNNNEDKEESASKSISNFATKSR